MKKLTDMINNFSKIQRTAKTAFKNYCKLRDRILETEYPLSDEQKEAELAKVSAGDFIEAMLRDLGHTDQTEIDSVVSAYEAMTPIPEPDEV